MRNKITKQHYKLMALLWLPIILQSNPAYSSEASGGNSKSSCGKVSLIKIPPSIMVQGSIEASGLQWIKSLQKFLIISDEVMEHSLIHSTQLFAMTNKGQLNQVLFSNDSQINDLEGITQDDEGFIYLIASQSLTKKGKNKAERNRFIKARLGNMGLEVISTIQLRSKLTHLAKNSKKFSKRLAVKKNDWENLNIEALAFRNGKLFLGIQSPTDKKKRGLIWFIRHPSKLFFSKELTADDIDLWAKVSMQAEGKTNKEGISGMTFLEDGRLVIVSGTRKLGTVWLAEQPGKNKELQALQVGHCKGLNPEGVSVFPSNSGRAVAIVFDQMKEKPVWSVLQLPSSSAK